LARFLALDWDHQLLHAVSANVGRGTVQIQRAGVWPEQCSPDATTIATLALVLRQRLKEAGIKPAPVLVSLGRDRVILKDIRYPQVPPAEEPAVVRFQASKELTDGADEVIIDYYPVADGGPGGERRALAFVVRRKVLAMYQELCRAAGLKLAGVTPRPFGIAAAVLRSAGALLLTPGPAAPGTAVAVLTVTDTWAEFCVVRDGHLLFTRSLTPGDGLLSEIRRNLALYAGQPHGGSAQDRVQALYVAGNGEHNLLREQLEQLLAIPVHPLDPFAGVDRLEVTGHRGGFTGAVGLLHLQAEGRKLPVNFAQPKEAKPERDPNRTRYLVYAGLALVALVTAFLYGNSLLKAKTRMKNHLAAEAESLTFTLGPLKRDSDNLKQLKTRVGSAPNVLDLLDEVSRRFPDTKLMQIKQLSISPAAGAVAVGGTAAAEPAVYQMELVGEFSGDEWEVNKLADWLGQNQATTRHRIVSKLITPPKTSERAPGKFSIRVEIEKLPPKKAPAGRKP
jgi:hypothetical protein